MNNTEKIKNKLKMRKAVGIILMRDDGLVWTGKRRDGPGVRSGEKKTLANAPRRNRSRRKAYRCCL